MEFKKCYNQKLLLCVTFTIKLYAYYLRVDNNHLNTNSIVHTIIEYSLDNHLLYIIYYF